MGTHSKNFFKTTILALSIMGLVACSSSGDEEMASTATRDTSAEDAASAAARAAAEREAAAREAQARIEQAALNTTVFYFDFDVSEFMAADRDVLAIHGRNLARNSANRIRLEGHADERGTREYNLALGQKRAEAVRKSLAALGVPDAQVEAVSLGEEKPRDAGSDEAAHAENRRADLVYQ